MSTPYTREIQTIAPTYDPRHVEAYMRIEHSTLDHLPLSRFRSEVRIACACIDQGGVDRAELLAKTFGF
jgi:hypothetical protein